MTYYEAVSIEMDFIVNMQYADVFGKEADDVIREVAEKYTTEQMGEAYTVIRKKKEEEIETVKDLFTLALSCKK